MTRALIVNPLNLTDSYKDGQYLQYPPNTQKIFEYYEARGGEYPYQVLFGLQYILKSKLEGRFFSGCDLEEAFENSQVHFSKGFPYAKQQWQYILDKYEGRLPLLIRAVKEGTPVPIKNVMMTIENTDPKCYWLTGWVEGLLQQVWYSSTVATKSRMVKQLYKEFLERTADNLDCLPFMLHDFGFRGVSSVETAALMAAAHLVNFRGIDTKVGMDLLYQFYDAPKVSGFSVAASEHSTMTTWGRNGEELAVGNLLDKFPTGILSIVGDSYDIYNFVGRIIGGTFRDRIRARMGKVVIRPDSGDPLVVVPRVLEILGQQFGIRENSRGFKVLPPCVGVIQGDGMDYYSIQALLRKLEELHWSVENVVTGMGGGLGQKLNRDTQKVAIKCSAAIINRKEVEVFKNPITDPGKVSKHGRQALLLDSEGRYHTMSYSGEMGYPFDILETVFSNGSVKRNQTLDEIRIIAEV